MRDQHSLFWCWGVTTQGDTANNAAWVPLPVPAQTGPTLTSIMDSKKHKLLSTVQMVALSDPRSFIVIPCEVFPISAALQSAPCDRAGWTEVRRGVSASSPPAVTQKLPPQSSLQSRWSEHLPLLRIDVLLFRGKMWKGGKSFPCALLLL